MHAVRYHPSFVMSSMVPHALHNLTSSVLALEALHFYQVSISRVRRRTSVVGGFHSVVQAMM